MPDELQKYNIDFGEADLIGENEDVVRIMSIHKSKGLEFPVVFLGGMGRKFNVRDIQQEFLLLLQELLPRAGDRSSCGSCGRCSLRCRCQGERSRCIPSST